MAKVLRTMSVYECPCGDLHEVLYPWREGIQIGPRFLCGSREMSVPTHETTRTVTLGLDLVGDVKTGTPDLDMIRLAKENERLRLDLDVAESRKSDVIRRLVEDGDRMRLVLHDLAFAAPHVGDEHRDQRGWMAPAAWGEYVSRVQKMAGGAIRRPPTDKNVAP